MKRATWGRLRQRSSLSRSPEASERSANVPSAERARGRSSISIRTASALRPVGIDPGQFRNSLDHRGDLAKARYRRRRRQVVMERTQEVEILGEIERPSPLRRGGSGAYQGFTP